MRRLVIALLAVAVALPIAVGEPTHAQPLHTSVSHATKVSDTLRALDRLHRMGYTVSSPQRASKAIRSWQKSNGLTVDGLVGVETLASLGLDGSSSVSATVPAVRLTPPVPPPAPGENEPVEQIIRDVWPDDLEDHAVAIATRESNLQPEVINRNRDATGLFQIMWSVHRVWLCPQLGICAQSALQDALTNATAAYALYQRDGGWGPWAL